MRIGLIIVGDEILSGRRQDQHLSALIKLLSMRGLVLSWMRVVADEPDLLVETFQQTFATGDVVFSTGGIGATPDDLTREAVAKALGISTERHPEGVTIMQRYSHETGRELTDARMRLIEFPAGSALIPNPINSIPGFSIQDHHFVPGFPTMATPMMEWVLNNHYLALADQQYRDEAIMVFNTYESAIIPVMEEILIAYPQLKIFSLPIIDHDEPMIEMGVKGNALHVKDAMQLLKSRLNELGSRWENR